MYDLDRLLEEEVEISHRLSRGDRAVGRPPWTSWMPFVMRMERRDFFYLILLGVLVAWWALVGPKVPMLPSVLFTSV